MKDEIIGVYEKEAEIKPLVEKLERLLFDELVKTDHLYYSLSEKGEDLEILKRKYSEFYRVKIIVKRKHKSNKTSYDFYYELEDGTYVLYAIGLDEEKPVLLNAYHVKRNFKHFKQSLLRAYGNKLTG